MTMKVVLVVALICAVATAQTAQSFLADVVITNDPRIVGTMRGQLYYSHNANERKLRISYNAGLGPGATEIFDEVEQVRYVRCSSTSQCSAETNNNRLPVLYAQGSDQTNVGSIGGCSGRRKADGSTIYLNNGNICRLIEANGRTIVFSNHRALPAGSFSVATWNCPQKQCNVMLDVVLVLDESGSIQVPVQWDQLKSFALAFVDGFDIGPNKVAVGVELFSDGGRHLLDLSTSRNTVRQNIQSMNRAGGWTCIGCGIDLAVDNFNRRGRTVNGRRIQRIAIVLTDGYNNRGNLPNSIANAKNAANNVTMFAIGVGSYNPTELNNIATVIPGVQTVFPVTNFNSLQAIITSLLTATCLDFNGFACGSGCRGFCCGPNSCICPTACEDNTACTVGTCDPNTRGCIYPPKDCTGTNRCLTYSCVEPIGCTNATLSCPRCFQGGCNPATGCIATTCTDNDPCTADSCNRNGNGDGCVYTPIPNCGCDSIDCPPPTNGCDLSICNPTNGQCETVPRPCYQNECSIGTCNRATGQCEFVPKVCEDGNMCTHDRCDPTIPGGCTFPEYTPADCDDGDMCTINGCDPLTGCTAIPRDCSDGLSCTSDFCDVATYGTERLGCGNPIRDCDAELPQNGRCHVSVCEEAPNEPSQLPGCRRRAIRQGDCAVATQEAAVLGGAVTAAVVSAALAVAAGLGVFGGKKGLDMYRKTRGGMGGAQANPLYQEGTGQGSNPFYEQEMA